MKLAYIFTAVMYTHLGYYIKLYIYQSVYENLLQVAIC